MALFPKTDQKKLTNSEEEPLKALCKIGLNAGDKGYWSNEDIIAAIASIEWGTNWPYKASATAYKIFNRGDHLNQY